MGDRLKNSGGKLAERIEWPQRARFAFSIFDDTDSQTLERGKPVYDFLLQLGLRTTKSVWVSRNPCHTDGGMTCDEPEYLAWVKTLQEQGFEIGWHMAGSCTSTRQQTIAGLDKFSKLFGHSPHSMANHYECKENIYFGDARVSSINRILYNMMTRFRNRQKFNGHTQGHKYFWGDECLKRIKYVRNFVFNDINTLNICPYMPYHDLERPYVKYWFASSEGANVLTYNRLLSIANQDRLEKEGGACIVYTHFGLGFTDPKTGKLNPDFVKLMESLAKRQAWFVPVTVLLDYLLETQGTTIISAKERRHLELRWMQHKLLFGSA